ncbi:hypothetical protein C8F01DRAFT_1371544 [Mycena amicta]|nr:hypothetical protein C8F01DRAFT_1371544 [Mycena amicta]
MLYFYGILGAANTADDGWIATDLAVASSLVANSATTNIFTTVPFRSFDACSGDYFKFGDPQADRLEVPIPDDSFVTVSHNGASLKNAFLNQITTVTMRMHPGDELVLFIAAQPETEKDTGNVLIGSELLSISEVAAAIKDNAKTILWSTACYSGKWLEGNVPWHSYVAAPAEELDSLVASNSHRHPGGTNYFHTPTAIREGNHRTLQDRADDANARRQELSWTYDVDATSTQRALPVPPLTSQILDRFRLVTRPASSSPATTTSASVKKTQSASFRRCMEALPPIAGVDLTEFVEFGAKLLDTRISKASLVTLSISLANPNLTQEDVGVLFTAFEHRRRCEIAIETFIKRVDWQSTRPPRWDFTGGGVDVETEMVGADKEAVPWRDFFTWRPQVPDAPAAEPRRFRELTWNDIRQQLALAWEGAGKPPFSCAEFLLVATNLSDVRKTDVIISSPSLQAIIHLMSLVDLSQQ